jgi:hypothetical protein
VLSGWTNSKDEFLSALMSTRASGGTYPEKGLRLAETLITDGGRYEAKSMVLLLLDGKPYGSYAAQAQETQKLAKVIAVGYDGGANVAALTAIATAPASYNTFSDHNLEKAVSRMFSDEFSLCNIARNETQAPSTLSPSGSPSSIAPTAGGSTYSPSLSPTNDPTATPTVTTVAPTAAPTAWTCGVTLDVVFVVGREHARARVECLYVSAHCPSRQGTYNYHRVQSTSPAAPLVIIVSLLFR